LRCSGNVLRDLVPGFCWAAVSPSSNELPSSLAFTHAAADWRWGRPIHRCPLGWCGIDASSPQDVAFARGWGRLAQEIGLNLREAILQARLSFAEAAGLTITPALVRQRQTGRSRRTRLEEYEGLIDQMASQWDNETLARLHAAEAEIRSLYVEGP